MATPKYYRDNYRSPRFGWFIETFEELLGALGERSVPAFFVRARFLGFLMRILLLVVIITCLHHWLERHSAITALLR
jgi:hypothetical protein